MVDAYSSTIVVLTVAAGGALLIERTIEALKHIIENVDDDTESSAAQTLKNITASVAVAAQTLEVFKKAEAKKESGQEYLGELKSGMALLRETPRTESLNESRDDDGELSDDAYEFHSAIAIRALSEPDEKERHKRKLTLFYHIAGLGLGITYASALDIHLLSELLMRSAQAPNLFLDKVLSGLVIAGGSQPIHVLLGFITTRKLTVSETVEPEDESEEALEQLKTPVALNAKPEAQQSPTWQLVNYRGGVKPESLENRNFRRANPNLIVFHHTAMSSQLGFQAIVDEFLINKGWSTGYHCVIMPDGAIRPFCRWDRVGNHTRGLNNLSLGVSFHGNFHLDQQDRFSNFDGRYGNKAPTKQQLDAGARLIALWMQLYEIPLNKVLTHREAKPGHTVCPGSNFPIEEFRRLVENTALQWQSSETMLEKIQEFKTRPYLYV